MTHVSSVWNSIRRPTPTQPSFKHLPPKFRPLRHALVRTVKNRPPWSEFSGCTTRVVKASTSINRMPSACDTSVMKPSSVCRRGTPIASARPFACGRRRPIRHRLERIGGPAQNGRAPQICYPAVTYGRISAIASARPDGCCGDMALTQTPGISDLMFSTSLLGIGTLKVMYRPSSSDETNSTGIV